MQETQESRLKIPLNHICKSFLSYAVTFTVSRNQDLDIFGGHYFNQPHLP